ncbi:patatin-like phospholipase family protein [Falsiroseomonas oryzae]|uniref:patatin-like phospholipase family protein n=1 Tax=Falsiroseomonas oryzae TaxID=2766473 RepID=UPI0022EB2EE0|nr:patatin-like phospholipase family protein [Roseomonas sp. MO-31]
MTARGAEAPEDADGRVLGVFEGGGAKGLAHVGALAAAERLGLTFAGVVGTSAGAVIATFVATGLTANEIFDPARQPRIADHLRDPSRHPAVHILREVAGRRPVDLFGRDWKGFRAVLRALGARKRASGVVRRAADAVGAVVQLMVRGILQRGWFDPNTVEAAMEEILQQRRRAGALLPPPAGTRWGPRVTFAEMPMPLRIVATDVGRGMPFVMDRDNTPDLAVATAVAASVAVPGVFRPVEIRVASARAARQLHLLDGGMVSNLPLWLCDDERAADPDLPVLAFRIADTPADLSRLVGFAAAVARTAVFGAQETWAASQDHVLWIPLRVDEVDMLDFDMDLARALEVHAAGFRAAENALDAQRMLLPWNQRSLMDAFGHEARAPIAAACGVAADGLRLRVSIVIRVSRRRLRVLRLNGARERRRQDLTLWIEDSIAGRCLTTRDAVCWLRRDGGRIVTAEGSAPFPDDPPMESTWQATWAFPLFADPGAYAIKAPHDRPEPLGTINIDVDHPPSDERTALGVAAALLTDAHFLNQFLAGLHRWRRYDGLDE